LSQIFLDLFIVDMIYIVVIEIFEWLSLYWKKNYKTFNVLVISLFYSLFNNFNQIELSHTYFDLFIVYMVYIVIIELYEWLNWYWRRVYKTFNVLVISFILIIID